MDHHCAWYDLFHFSLIFLNLHRYFSVMQRWRTTFSIVMKLYKMTQQPTGISSLYSLHYFTQQTFIFLIYLQFTFKFSVLVTKNASASGVEPLCQGFTPRPTGGLLSPRLRNLAYPCQKTLRHTWCHVVKTQCAGLLPHIQVCVYSVCVRYLYRKIVTCLTTVCCLRQLRSARLT